MCERQRSTTVTGSSFCLQEHLQQSRTLLCMYQSIDIIISHLPLVSRRELLTRASVVHARNGLATKWGRKSKDHFAQATLPPLRAFRMFECRSRHRLREAVFHRRLSGLGAWLGHVISGPERSRMPNRAFGTAMLRDAVPGPALPSRQQAWLRRLLSRLREPAGWCQIIVKNVERTNNLPKVYTDLVICSGQPKGVNRTRLRGWEPRRVSLS